METSLPVEQVLPSLIQTLQTQSMALLEAPAGAGKSTLVPPALLKAGLAGQGKIYLLEPRRLAARSLAHFISAQLGDNVGGICGYRVHRETRVSAQTRIEVITQGILIRILQKDPALQEGAMVIFDEFHERNLLSDLALSLLLEVKEALREDLSILFMSATPDKEALLSLLPDLPVIKSPGRQFPVDIHYRQSPKEINPGPAIEEALKKTSGDILVFLPGEREIRRWMDRLESFDGEVLSLYGRMSLEQQNQVISPRNKNRKRRIILSTDIAETSLTIPGITAVVDSGLARKPVFSASSGLTLLETVEISMASAQQRAGRAGRTAPGHCFRLWDKAAERQRDLQTDPEILHADLSPMVLELARWGCRDPRQRRWLTPPDKAAWHSGSQLLKQLGALDDQGKITDKGNIMAEMPVHPRLAALLYYGKQRGLPAEASLMAAYLSQRDFLPQQTGSDLMSRISYLTGERSAGEYSRVVNSIFQEADHLARFLRLEKGHIQTDYTSFRVAAPLLAAEAYPDRIAQRVEQGVYQLSGGGRIELHPSDPLIVQEFLVAAHCGGHRDRQRLFLGIAIERKELELLFLDQIKSEIDCSWDKKNHRIRSEQRRRLGQITLNSTALKSPKQNEMADYMKGLLLKEGMHFLPWDKAARRFWDRMIYAGSQLSPAAPAWPDLSDQALAEKAGQWLIPFMREGKIRESLTVLLRALLDWEQLHWMEHIAPDHYVSALGNSRKIIYGEGSPYLPIPLQEMYGCEESPRIGREPLTLHLLNPAGRPVQITADLKSFWNHGWKEVRSELKGRYPKHYWPEDPARAEATLKTGKNRPG